MTFTDVQFEEFSMIAIIAIGMTVYGLALFGLLFVIMTVFIREMSTAVPGVVGRIKLWFARRLENFVQARLRQVQRQIELHYGHLDSPPEHR